jgi:hypothetical protein
MKEILLEILTILSRMEICLNEIKKSLEKEDEKRKLLND